MAKRMMARRKRRVVRAGERAMSSWSPSEYQKRMERSSFVFLPEVQAPKYGLALFKHLVESGGLYAADDLEGGGKLAGRHFPDGYNWSHFRRSMRYFKFDGVSPIALDVGVAVISTLLMSLRDFGGTEFAFRTTCALFEEVLGTARVDFPDGSEPVAALTVLSGDDREEGWDAYFPHYNLYVMRTLERAVDRGLSDKHLMRVAMSPVGSDLRKSVEGLVQLVYDRGADGAARMGAGDLLTGGVLHEIIKENPGLFGDSGSVSAPLVSPIDRMIGDATYSVIKAGAGKAWGDQLRALLNTEIGRGAPYPIAGYDHSALDRLAPVQRYGAQRPHHDGTHSKHGGLDLPGSRGAEVRAVYGGRVIALRRDWTAEDAKKQTPSWSAGNYLIIETPGLGGASVRVGYYHLDSVADGLDVGSTVAQAAPVGAVGTTGNSTGPHLHLDARWIVASPHTGRSSSSWPLDPEIVLTRGAVEAARVAGADLLAPGKPVLGAATFALNTIAGPGFVLPYQASLVDDGEVAGGIMDFINNFSKNMSEKMVKSMQTGVLGTVLRKGFNIVGLPDSVANTYIEATAQGWAAAKKSGGDPVETLKGFLRTKGLPEAAITVAAQAAASGALDDPKIGDGEDPTEHHAEPGEE